ncbi:ThuA domain-containing protein [Aquihabitans daechungensis]|uniref:ThuA domain-containing protein n=1 Tax=Aquihabitans daechungensis TaxID=1052257 RepID=UPI003BA07BFB
MRVLLLHGGWPGHEPAAIATWAATTLFGDTELVVVDDLAVLDRSELATFDLLCPLWTFGELSEHQEDALLGSVADGLGLVAWHGNTSAFLTSRAHKHLLGGQFVAHPGGAHVDYTVRFRPDALTAGLGDVAVRSEQYYLLVDPAVHVLATTEMVADDEPWLAGVEMPVAWTRSWGAGRVAYVSIGHGLEELDIPEMTELLRRLVRWAARAQRSA